MPGRGKPRGRKRKAEEAALPPQANIAPVQPPPQAPEFNLEATNQEGNDPVIDFEAIIAQSRLIPTNTISSTNNNTGRGLAGAPNSQLGPNPLLSPSTSPHGSVPTTASSHVDMLGWPMMISHHTCQTNSNNR